MHFYNRYSFALAFLAGVIMTACSAEGDNPGVEFAPQMYHSIPYEPLSQVTDKSAGIWLNSSDDPERGEFYSSNSYNEHNMTMREPAPNTVRRTANGILPVLIPADTLGSTYWLDYASANLKSPLDSVNREAVVKNGAALYARFCFPCHGGTGKGDGPVGNVIKGVPSFSFGNYQNMTEGHIFHVTTYGKGRMAPYASQLSVEERWEVAAYIKELQKQ